MDKKGILLNLLPEIKEDLKEVARANGTTMTWEATVAIKNHIKKARKS